MSDPRAHDDPPTVVPGVQPHGAVTPDQGEPAQTSSSQAQSPPDPPGCYRHPDRVTRLRCTRCDRPVCTDCLRPAAVGQLCPDDARERTPGTWRPSGTDRPVVVYGILAVNTVMLLVAALLSSMGSGQFLLSLFQLGPAALNQLGALNSAAIVDGQWWRLLTVMVLHAGLVHFALNSLALYLYGPTLERLLGSGRFLALYVISGFVGSAASFTVGRTTLGVGASGAIFGLLGALIAYAWRRRDRGGMAQLQGLLLIVGINLFLAVSIPNIDNAAHIGGLLGGFAVMTLVETFPARSRLFQVAAFAVPAVAGVLLVLVGVVTFPG